MGGRSIAGAVKVPPRLPWRCLALAALVLLAVEHARAEDSSCEHGAAQAKLRAIAGTAAAVPVAVTADARGAAAGGSGSSPVMAPSPPSSTTTPLAPEGMVWVPGGEFEMGAVEGDTMARPDEKPRHRVRVDGFFMDATEVTNRQFAKFVAATGYKTIAERRVEWEQIRKDLPPGSEKPPDEAFDPGALVFTPEQSQGDLRSNDWWAWKHGADWRHPRGPGSEIEGWGDHPVVEVAWDDAEAYAKWAGKRLPTEAEWESAARGGRAGEIQPWGDEPPSDGKPKANTWDGKFPSGNTKRDGWEFTSPVRSYTPNRFGLYDISGNVWEWCSDWYRFDTYAVRADKAPIVNPQGPADSYDPEEAHAAKRVQRGGSFLCSASYCASYRSSARMKTTPDTGLSHTGFRCVRSAAATSPPSEAGDARGG